MFKSNTQPRHIREVIAEVVRAMQTDHAIYGALLRIAGQSIDYHSDGEKALVCAPTEALMRIFNALTHYQNLIRFLFAPDGRSMIAFPLRPDLIAELLREELEAA